MGLISLSSYSSIKENELIERVKKISTILLIVSIPLTLYFSFYSELIIKILFLRGAFTEESVKITASILFGLSIGLSFQIISYVLIKILNARFENRKVLKYMAISLFFNAFFNILFYKFFGALTIGVAVSLYGLILFILTMNYFKILGYIIKETIFILPFGILYLLISKLVNIEYNFIGLIITLAIFLFYWFLVIILVPKFKKNIELIKGLK